jgi:hypothetical protein
MMNVRLREGVYSTTKDGETVLIDSATGVFFALNLAGTEILTALGQGDFDGLIRNWAQQFGLPESEIRGDINEFCRQLTEQHLVEVDEADSTSRAG